MIKEVDVLDALKKVIEPDLGKNIVELDLVTIVSSSDKSLSLRVETKNAAMHARKRMKEACQFAIERSLGGQINVEVEVVAMKKAEASQQILPNIKNIVAVVSGKGGVGKSTIAANLATGFAKKGLKVGILDADIYGPSLPMMFDVQHYKPLSRVVNNKQLIVPAENYNVKLLSIGFFATSPIDFHKSFPSACFFIFSNICLKNMFFKTCLSFAVLSLAFHIVETTFYLFEINNCLYYLPLHPQQYSPLHHLYHLLGYLFDGVV